MLALLVQVADARLAIDVRDVVQVLPMARLERHALGPSSLAGLLVFHGRLIPTFDLSVLRAGQPTAARLRSRLIAIQSYQAGEEQPYAICVDQVMDVRSFADDEFVPGRLLLDDQGPIEPIDVRRLLPPDVSAWLGSFCAAEVGG